MQNRRQVHKHTHRHNNTNYIYIYIYKTEVKGNEDNTRTMHQKFVDAPRIRQSSLSQMRSTLIQAAVCMEQEMSSLSDLSCALCKSRILAPVLPIWANTKTFWISKNILQQLASRRNWTGIRKFHSIFNHIINFRLNCFKLRLSGQIVFENVFLQA